MAGAVSSFDPVVPLIAHYGLLILALLMGVELMRRRRGASLLAFYVLANAVQVGLGLAWLPGFLERSGYSFDEKAYFKLVVSSIVFSAICIPFLLYQLRRFKAVVSPPVVISYPVRLWGGVFFICFVFIAVRVAAPTTRYALENIDLLFGEGYYRLRADMIIVGLESYSRVTAWFVNILRSALFLLFAVFIYNAIVLKNGRSWWLVAVTFSALFVDALARLQKAPIVVIIILMIAAVLVGGAKERRGGKVLIGVGARYSALGILALLISGYVASSLQGIPFFDSLQLAVDRLIFIPELSTFMHFQAYPDLLPHVNFGSMRAVAALFDISTAPLNGSIALDVAVAVTGTVYNANAGLVANAWANFGYFGVVIYSLVACVLFMLIDAYVDRRLPSGPYWPIAAYYAGGLLIYANASLEDGLIMQGLFFVPFMYVFIVKRSRLDAQ